jgi:hypothetical protein
MRRSRRPVALHPSAQRRQVEPRTGRITAGKREQRAADRTREHLRDDARRVPVLAKDVSQARALAPADVDERRRGQRFLLVHDDQLGVVLDARAQVDGADEVLRLLPG